MPDEIPSELTGWSIETIRRLLAQGVLESTRFDFKEMLPHPKNGEDKTRLVRACAAFANSGGGFLIFGVADDRAIPPERRLVGTSGDTDFLERFGNYPSAAEPAVNWDAMNPPLHLDPNTVVHVIHILPAERGPHAVREHESWAFYKRTHKGTEAMSHREIERAFAEGGQRRTNLRMLRAEVARLLADAKDINVRNQAERYSPALYLSRLAPEQIVALMRVTFEDIESHPSLRSNLENLVHWASKTDRALALAAASRPSQMSDAERMVANLPSPQELLRDTAPQTVNAAERVLKELESLVD